MSDLFSTSTRSQSDPAAAVFVITPDDAADLPFVTTALNVHAPGKVRVTTADGSIADVSVSAGQMFSIRARRVWQTGTTATGIRGLT